MEYLMRLNVGDWSKDGHEKCDSYLLNCNKPHTVIQEGYKTSCKLTGLQFNGNEDYTGLGNKRSNQMLNEYVQYSLTDEQVEILLKFEGFKDLGIDTEYVGSMEFVSLFMWFVGLSIPDLEWKFRDEPDNIPNINGYWDKNLNITIGYGLFD